MKKWVAIAVAAAFLAAAPFPASAGDKEWATAGKILTGMIGVTILGNAIAGAYYYPAPVYAPPPRVYYPPAEVWVPGHWEIGNGGRGHDGGRGERYGGYGKHRDRRIWVPGHYRDVEVRVWIPGRWEVRG